MGKIPGEPGGKDPRNSLTGMPRNVWKIPGKGSADMHFPSSAAFRENGAADAERVGGWHDAAREGEEPGSHRSRRGSPQKASGAARMFGGTAQVPVPSGSFASSWAPFPIPQPFPRSTNPCASSVARSAFLSLRPFVPDVAHSCAGRVAAARAGLRGLRRNRLRLSWGAFRPCHGLLPTDGPGGPCLRCGVVVASRSCVQTFIHKDGQP